jgi:hypothetical protein
MRRLIAVLAVLASAGCATTPVKPSVTIHFPEGGSPEDPEQVWVCANLDGAFQCIRYETFMSSMHSSPSAGTRSGTTDSSGTTRL